MLSRFRDFFCVVVCATSAFAGDNFSIEKFAGERIEGMTESYALIDVRLNEQHQRVIKNPGFVDKKLLIEGERSWVKYRDAECKEVAGEYGPATFMILRNSDAWLQRDHPGQRPASPRTKPPIQRQGRSVDHRRVIAQQKRDGSRHLAGLGEAAEGDAGQHRGGFGGVAPGFVGHGRQRDDGVEAVDTDAVGAEFQGHDLGDGVERGFGGAVGQMVTGGDFGGQA